MSKESEFGGGPGTYQSGAEAAGFVNLPDPTGVRDVWAIFASDPTDANDSGKDLTKVALQAPGIGSVPDEEE